MLNNLAWFIVGEYGGATGDLNRFFAGDPTAGVFMSGFFPVIEAVAGEVVGVRRIRRQVPVEEYLREQGRYAHLFTPERRDDVIARLQAIADRNIARYGLLEEVA